MTRGAAAEPGATAPLRVALIGHGAMGKGLAGLVRARPDMTLVGVMVRANATVDVALDATIMVTTLEALLALRPDVVVEAAGHSAVQRFAAPCLLDGCDVLLASVGALADARLQAELTDAAQRSGRQVLLPCGALGGLDYLQAACSAGLDQVRLRSSKPPAAWRGTEAETRFDLAALTTPTRLFQGSAREAALRYPKNANVAATLALATVGLDATQVELVADPGCTGNRHQVWANGAAGSMQLTLDNAAAPDNPKTSLITAHSLLRSLHQRRALFSY